MECDNLCVRVSALPLFDGDDNVDDDERSQILENIAKTAKIETQSKTEAVVGKIYKISLTKRDQVCLGGRKRK